MVKIEHDQQLIQMSMCQVEMQEGRHRVNLHVCVRVCVREVRERETDGERYKQEVCVHI